MTDYTKLVKALRHCVSDEKGVIKCAGCPYYPDITGCMDRLHTDAAAAIEALQAEVNKLVAQLANAVSPDWTTFEQQLPKRGEWELIDGAEPMRWGCSRCKYLSWDTPNYCPRCGAKMEVQE